MVRSILRYRRTYCHSLGSNLMELSVFNPQSFHFRKGSLILIDKPIEWTSFDAVNSIRYTLRHHVKIPKIKVGHAGTLDPLATGLLLICTGKYTKMIESLQGCDKVYTGSIHLGMTTPSFDAETRADAFFDITGIKEEMIYDAAKKLSGPQQQMPPQFSAVKVDGKKAYELARSKRKAKLQPRDINIHYFKITEIKLPEVYFEVHCSKGTYIRSLAHDFGKVLNNGAYLSSLRRTKVGEYSLDGALSPQEFKEQLKGALAANPSLCNQEL